MNLKLSRMFELLIKLILEKTHKDGQHKFLPFKHMRGIAIFVLLFSVIAPKEAGAGKIDIQIDGKTHAMGDLPISGTRQAQQVVCEITGLTSGKHTISIVNRGSGPVSVDALIVQ